MLNADSVPVFSRCPRCDMGGFERLKTHGYCINCNYSTVHDSGELLALPKWAHDALKAASRIKAFPAQVERTEDTQRSESDQDENDSEAS